MMAENEILQTLENDLTMDELTDSRRLEMVTLDMLLK